ncbi:hypothetical protein PHYSODRAFT_329750 [Phytophthora sojae]|uniref:Copper transport protein n=1 Tax=Phytophthora sojae (strain P6497) TaxID=1094619 RepID=G4Z8D5_PHYSP|nr:hypothetical protein PHYSODRAFT_329750 [Phytophthora sojae]EGZ21855.1 hypothetical protein PHYSODRAFT_329750 [Phytophthora sojae]|eukprot:XP_009524572.1 hypothetical protein PHYSODRAFT_329750 [Phytophthora sojae]
MASARRLWSLVEILLLWMALSADASQNLRKTTCPVCNMDAKADINAPILGDQHVYACEMAGHIDTLRSDPGANLGQPEAADIITDEIYKDATDISCPVCGKGYSQLTHAVPWIPQGAQKIYTCSEEHAQMVHDDPTAYIAAQTSSSSSFCNSGAAARPMGSVMFNGFQLTIGSDSTCLLLLFQSWVLSSAVKYAFAFLGVVLLAMSLEGFGELREHSQKWLVLQHGVVVTQADYVSLSTPHVNSVNGLESSALKPGRVLPISSEVTVIRRLPLHYKAVLAVLYMVHLCLGYWVMLAVMTYETLMFVAVIVGLGLGFAVFKDTEADTLSGSVDPCCSS